MREFGVLSWSNNSLDKFSFLNSCLLDNLKNFHWRNHMLITCGVDWSCFLIVWVRVVKKTVVCESQPHFEWFYVSGSDLKVVIRFTSYDNLGNRSSRPRVISLETWVMLPEIFSDVARKKKSSRPKKQMLKRSESLHGFVWNQEKVSQAYELSVSRKQVHTKRTTLYFFVRNGERFPL